MGRNTVIGDYFDIGPQEVTNILTYVENELEKSQALRIEIDKINCTLKV